MTTEFAASLAFVSATFAGVLLAANAANAVNLQGIAARKSVAWAWLLLMSACAALTQLVIKDTMTGASALLVLTALAYFSVFDVRFMAAPVVAVVVCAAGGVAAAWLINPDLGAEHLVAALAGAAAFLILGRAFEFIRGRSGLGEGDALIAGLIGAWLSWDGLIGSVAIGAPLGIVWALLRRDLRAPLPLVPALSAGVVIFLCSGSKPW